MLKGVNLGVEGKRWGAWGRFSSKRLIIHGSKIISCWKQDATMYSFGVQSCQQYFSPFVRVILSYKLKVKQSYNSVESQFL